jgi:hypothetical protein
MQEYYGLTGRRIELLNLNLNKVKKDWIYKIVGLIKYIKTVKEIRSIRPDLGS